MEMFGNKIKSLRKQQGIKQKDLASHLKIATSTLSQYENNKRHPNFFILKEIALFFNVTTDFLLGLESKKKSLSFKRLKDIDFQLSNDFSFNILIEDMTTSLYDIYENKDYKSLQIMYHLYESISHIASGYTSDSPSQSVEKIISSHQKHKEGIDQNLNNLFRHHLKYYGK
jgi:transcriptional regulator with XRE-family HTH domain